MLYLRIRLFLLLIFISNTLSACELEIMPETNKDLSKKCDSVENKKKPLYYQILGTSNLIALWDFSEESGCNRGSVGMRNFQLREFTSHVDRIADGPISGFSGSFKNGAFLSLPNEETAELNIYGNNREVTVLAWIKWDVNTGIAFICGLWDEFTNGGKRQYGLFVNLPKYNGKNNVCGHISRTGKPTPPFPYSVDYSASKQTVLVGDTNWNLIGFTYDGYQVKSYCNGVFLNREVELINDTKGFPGYENGMYASKNPYIFPFGMGNNGANFTVGGNLIHSGYSNFFNGKIAGIAIFDRVLSDVEIINFQP